jgi:putative polymerase
MSVLSTPRPIYHVPVRSLSPYVAFAAVLGAMTFNMVLCLVNTKVGVVGNGAIIACEIAIIAAVLLFAYPAIDTMGFLIVSSAMLYLLSLTAIRVAFQGEGLQIKPLRDLLIPIAFLFLGMRAADVRRADLLVRIAGFLVVTVGLIEYAFPDRFTEVFNIAKFYIDRGSMGASQAAQSSNLFISGMRPEGLGGRNLLPFLGDHRVSSIFLEPISAGNFGIIAFMWGLVRSLQTRRVTWDFFVVAVVMIVLSDSRFGAMFCVMAALLALMPVALGAVMAASLPAAALLALLLLPDDLSKLHVVGNGFINRLILSGRFLGALDLQNWFGVKSPEFMPFDSGYAYAFIGVGVVGAVGFWAMLWAIEGTTWQFRLFRNLTGAYYGVLLCVSNSPFTIKTASLLWFLFGVLAHASQPTPSAPRRSPYRQTFPAAAGARRPVPSSRS